MMKRDLAPVFKVDPGAQPSLRYRLDGDLSPRVQEHWQRRLVEALEGVSDDWRACIAVKVVTDTDGNELRLPVIVVESENLP